MRLLPADSAEGRLPRFEIGLLWLTVVATLAALFWPKLDESFASPDNLMRLVQVRGLLDGAPWFDPHEPRFAPPLGYDTHWSRLIDAGVGGMILLFRTIVSPDLAERLARCIWPLLLSGPTVCAVAAIASRLGGVGAGRAALLAALTTLPLLPIFRPGEIDHHNLQVMLALTIVACAMWSERPYMAAAAGLAGGVLLSVGLEAAHILAAVAATFGLLIVFDPAWRRPAAEFGSTLTLSTLAGYLALTPGAFRFASACDALAVNSAVAVAVGGAGIVAVAWFGGTWTRGMRFFGLGCAGILALGIYVAFEPRCLHGPFGLIDRTIFSLWLDRVREMQSVWSLLRIDGIQALVYIAFPVATALSVVLLVRNGISTPFGWALIVAFSISVLIMCSQIRMLFYVTWLGLPLVGAAVQLLAERTSRPPLTRVLAAVLASPPIVAFVAMTLTSQMAQTRATPNEDADDGCFRSGDYRTLASLPVGMVFGPIDLGPAILAHTPHSIVAAPYQRADRAVRFNQEVMAGTSAEARPRIIERGADYVVTCIVRPATSSSGSFNDALLAEAPGPWLVSVPTPATDRVKIWRVVR